MSAYAEKTGPASVRMERLLPGPIERVWAYLTESDKRGAWFASGAMDLRTDAKVSLHFDHNSLTPHQEPIPDSHTQVKGGIDIPVYITACEPPQVLAWGQEPGRIESSDVIFELIPEGNRVRLTIIQQKLGDRQTMVGVSAAWHTHCNVFDAVVNGTEIPPFWSELQRYTAEYDKRIP